MSSGDRKPSDENRPDPEKLLARIKTQEMQMKRGKLKIFFGAAAGVGKTYNMLDAAHQRRVEGVDVVVGYIEPHARPETQALIDGLEVIPLRIMEYKGTQLKEFDLDVALQRRPTLILVDELAHTNVPGTRHPKRWQDVEELLAAGINVYTTLNVQHIESLSDIVAQITGTVVRETVPDSIVENADEVELIDVSPDDLLQRLKEGKVYIPHQAERAMRNFFRKGNLMALRELALRRTADRVDEQMQDYMRDHAVHGMWPATERILVCISPSPLSTRLVRAAKRMATGLHAEWIALYVEGQSTGRMSEADRNRVLQTLRLAEQLGGEAVTLSGYNTSEEILSYARERNVNRIIVGKPVHPRWRDVLFGSVLDDLVRHSGEIDIYVINGDVDETQPRPVPILQRTSKWSAYAKASGVVLLFTLLAGLIFPFFAPANLIMLYLVGVVIVAARYGRGPAILASILSVAAFDFLYIPPYLTFHVADTQYIVTFAVMLLVALTISTMTVRIKQQAENARERERRTSSLYTMSRGFANSQNTEDLVKVATENMSAVFNSKAAVLLPDDQNNLTLVNSDKLNFNYNDHERSVAHWVYQHGQLAGLGTETLPGSQGLYLPLVTPRGIAGVIAIYPSDPQRFVSPDQLHLLEMFVNQTALALERTQLSEETERAQFQIETERMRSSLLSSISHDLRTPLTTITGAVSTLLENESTLNAPNRRELAQIAYEEAERLNRLLANLLDMTKLESGSIHVNKEWQSLEEVVGAALNRLDKALKDRPINVRIPSGFPLVPFDSILLEQVLVNLVENAVKYTPSGSPIDLSAELKPHEAVVAVADRGPGIPSGDEQRIFDKFYRVRPTKAGGVGLGLSICRAIVEAHSGRIWVENGADGGSMFRFTLPLNGTPPQVEVDHE